MTATDTSVIEERRLSELFEAFSSGDLESFLAGCSQTMLLTVWGSALTSTFVPHAELVEWHAGLVAVTEGSLRSEVLLVLGLGLERLVMLRHRFVLDGQLRRYDTINHCVLHDGELVAWFSRPASPAEYAAAWNVRPGTTRGTVAGRAASPRSLRAIESRPA